MDTLDVGGTTCVAFGVETELISAAWTADRSQVRLAIPAMYGPVIVAVVVNGSVAVEEQSVLAVLEGQGAVRAEEKRVADLGMRVREDSVWLGT